MQVRTIKRMCPLLLSTSIALTVLCHPGGVAATEPADYKTTQLAKGRFVEMDLSGLFLPGMKTEGNKQLRQSLQQTKGFSDVYVQNNVWAPGGSTGWHSHLGHSLIIVTAGAVTDYEGHDLDCTPHVYKTGMGFVDPGGDHVHLIRNEGDVEAKTVAVQFITADAARRIDMADPGNCHF